MIHFLDSSALVRRYIVEPGSDRIRSAFRGRSEVAVSRLTEIEVSAALARRARAGDLSNQTAQRHANDLRDDLQEFRVVEVRPPVLQLASELIWRCPLKAYDALQLASALRLAHATRLALTFWCADKTLCDCADDEGLRVQRL